MSPTKVNVLQRTRYYRIMETIAAFIVMFLRGAMIEASASAQRTFGPGWRRFNSDDWIGFAGAERFEDGSDPFVTYDIVLGGTVDPMFIVDANGLAVYADPEELVPKVVSFDRDHAFAALVALAAGTDWAHLVALPGAEVLA